MHSNIFLVCLISIFVSAIYISYSISFFHYNSEYDAIPMSVMSIMQYCLDALT